MMFDSEAFSAGANAYMSGYPITSNPFAKDDPSFNDFEDGWAEAFDLDLQRQSEACREL